MEKSSCLGICIFVYLIISVLGCSNTKIHCWKTIRDGECMSIKSYEGWNRCVASCETDPKYRGKTKPYESKKWTRPRPYICLLYTSDAADE